MIEEQATVLAVNGRRVEIEVQRQNSCGQCSVNASCGVGALGRLLGKRDKSIIINSELNLKSGDHILLGIPEKGVLSASVVVYGLPLLMLFVSAMLAQLVSNGSELAVSVSAIVGFLAGMFLSSIVVNKRYAAQLNPRVLQVNNEPISRF